MHKKRGRYVTNTGIKKSHRLDKILRRIIIYFVYQFWLAYLLAAFRYVRIDICSLGPASIN